MSDLAAELVTLGVATLHEAGGRRGLVRGPRLLVGPPFAGPALTVALPAGDNLGVHLALEAAEPGAVVCIASAGGGAYGVLGELLFRQAAARRISGLVVDDGIRDLAELAAPPSIAALGIHSQGTVKRRVRQPVGATVPLGGTCVASGDWIVCDADGVCVIPFADVPRTVAAAQDRAAAEGQIRAALAAGGTTRELLDLPAARDGSLG